jgi:hypothetical protein
MLRTAD